MILLFGEKAHKSNSSHKNSNIKNHPVENSGILANRGGLSSLLDANEYDMYMFSVQAEIDYSQYSSENGYSIAAASYTSEYSIAMDSFSDSSMASFSGASFGGDCGCSCGGFTSFG